jgi:putative membrane protein
VIRLLLRSIAINLLCIFITAQVLSGVISYVGGYKTLLLAAAVISLVNLLIRPIINLLLLPINLVTLGMFRWLSNLLTLYLVTWTVPNLQIHPFVFPGLQLKYIIIPEIHFTPFGAFVITTLTLTLVFHFIYWLLQD